MPHPALQGQVVFLNSAHYSAPQAGKGSCWSLAAMCTARGTPGGGGAMIRGSVLGERHGVEDNLRGAGPSSVSCQAPIRLCCQRHPATTAPPPPPPYHHHYPLPPPPPHHHPTTTTHCHHPHPIPPPPPITTTTTPQSPPPQPPRPTTSHPPPLRSLKDPW
jgi:hypothetical protein